MARLILLAEDFDARFETLCIQVFSKVDGKTYIPTSKSWDLGKDGRVIQISEADNPPLLAVSLRSDIQSKAEQDLARIHETTAPAECRMCFCEEITEHRRQEILKRLRKKYPNLKRLAVDGLTQLYPLLLAHPEPFEELYAAELLQLKRTLSTDSQSEKHHLDGLRIALTTQLTDDATLLRLAVSKNLILSELENFKPQTIATLSVNLSHKLHLPTTVHPEYLTEAIESLQAENLISRSGDCYSISDKGIRNLAESAAQASKSTLRGPNYFRESVADLIGEEIPEKDFARLWALLQDEMAAMFLNNGIHIMQAITGLLSKAEAAGNGTSELEAHIVTIRKKIIASGIGGSRAPLYARAIADVFTEPKSPALNWLRSLATIYISVCSLGLEPKSQKRIQECIKNLDLILDTDIAISYLCSGESNHPEVKRIVMLWLKLGGKVLLLRQF